MFHKSKQAAEFLYQHSFIRYVFVGGTTFIIDFFLLVLLHAHLNVNLEISTTLSYWIAIAYNFLLNRHWTFSSTDRKNLKKHLIFYLLLLGFNYLFTLAFVSIGSNFINFALAKILAVGIQISWTYYLYRNKIFVN